MPVATRGFYYGVGGRALPPPEIIKQPVQLEELPGLRFEELPLDEQLALSTSGQSELKSRPPHRRGSGAKSRLGGDCTRYFKRTNPNTGKTEWKILTGQPCGPDPFAPRPQKPKPIPIAKPKTPAPPNCSAGSAHNAHIQLFRELDPNSTSALANWDARASALLRTELPLCSQFADQFITIGEEMLRGHGASRAAMPPRMGFFIRYIDKIVAGAIRSDRPPKY